MSIQKIAVPLVFLLSLTAIFYITGNKVNQYGGSDSLLTLPTSQAIVQTGHTYLTNWGDRPITPSGQSLSAIIDNYQATQWNDEIIDVFSPGPALLTAPLVAVLSRAGFDLVDPSTNMAVQNRLAFITSAIVLLSLFALCLIHTDWLSALIISHVGFFGSSLFANMGQAFFNLNYTAVFVCWSLIILSMIVQDHPLAQKKWFMGAALGLCLFLGFINRPSVAILIAITFGYLWLYQRPFVWMAMTTAAVCLALFCAWSLQEYGQWLPLYLNPTKTDDAILPLWMGVIGNLVSPSRGVFIFMPWLLLIPIGLFWLKNGAFMRLALSLLLWFSALLIVVSSSVIWWGGASFGPRVMAEAIPGLILILAISWQSTKGQLKNSARYGLVSTFGAMAIFSIWVNSYQPFFNVFTAGPWLDNMTGYPVIDGRSPYFVWENSQWLADADQICELNESVTAEVFLSEPRLIAPLGLKESITPQVSNRLNLEQMAEDIYAQQPIEQTPVPAVTEGFLLTEGAGKWSICDDAEIYFRPDAELAAIDEIKVVLVGASAMQEPIPLFLNEQPIGEIFLDQTGSSDEIIISGNQLDVESLNKITFNIPQNIARSSPLPQPASASYGLRLDSLTLEVAD